MNAAVRTSSVSIAVFVLSIAWLGCSPPGATTPIASRQEVTSHKRQLATRGNQPQEATGHKRRKQDSSLVLDHFYFGLSAEELTDMSQLKDLNLGFSHLAFPDPSNDRVFGKTRSKVYIEFFDRTAFMSSFGVAVSKLGKEDNLAEKMSSRWPELDWTVTPAIGPDGTRFFDYIHNGPFDGAKMFNFAMQYYGAFAGIRGEDNQDFITPGPFGLTQVTRVEAEVPRDVFAELAHLVSWVGELDVPAANTRFSIPTALGEPVVFHVIPNNQITMSRPKRIEATLEPDVKVEPRTSEFFKLTQRKQTLIIDFKNRGS